LERDTFVAHVLGKWAELHDPVLANGHVLDEAHPMTDPVRAAVLERLPDRRRPKGLARVDRDGEVLAAAELERFEVRLRGMPSLLAGDVEAHDAPFAIRHRELGHLERIGAVAHRADDLAQRDAVVAL